MKKKLALCAFLLTAFVAKGLACTNLIVGKNASTDGSTIVSYSADSYGLFGELYHWPAATHPNGAMQDIYEWDSGQSLGQIEHSRPTYNVLGNINEFQPPITETPLCAGPALAYSTDILV